MHVRNPRSSTEEGTEAAPGYYDGPNEVIGDLRLNQRYFLYRTPLGLVSGKTFSITFTIDRPTRDVWPVFKDFNLWQNSHNGYSGVVGDLDGKSFQLSSQPDLKK